MKDSKLRLAVILWGVVALMNVLTLILNLMRGGDALLVTLQGVTAAASLVTFALVLRISCKEEE